MTTRYLIPGIAAILILLTLNILFAPDQLTHSATSFGVGPDGYKAAYDLLSELHVPVARSYVRPSQVPVTRILWFVDPFFLNTSRRATSGEIDELKKWMSSGGTAVVLGDGASVWDNLDLKRQTVEGADSTIVSGDFTRSPRTLDVPKLLHFDAGNDHARVRLDAAGEPFALDMKVGAGRLVAIADSDFLINRNLATEDASVLLVDLVRDLGPPTFDEWSHGVVTSASFVGAMASSGAMLPLIFGMLAALAWAIEQHSWPRRSLPERSELPDPSIVSYVESLGILYSRSCDPGAVFRAYRAAVINRMRRRASKQEVSEETIVKRIASDRSLSGETRRWLVDGASPASEEELVTAVRAIESYSGLEHYDRQSTR